MTEVLIAVTLLPLCAAAVLFWRSWRLRARALRRLGTPVELAAEAEEPTLQATPFVRPRPWLAYLGGVVLGVGLAYGTRLGVSFSAAFGLIAALLGAHVEQLRVGRRTARIEAQLADALDLMVSALSAGTGALQALDVATREASRPLRPQLKIVVQRIRYGDDPRTVLGVLEESVPLPTFRLFAAALAVHWEVGGSLTGPLAVVGRTIRDRIELSRRVRAMAMQSWASVGAVLVTTYFIALVMWRTDPDRMAAFLATGLGRGLFAVVLVLQALGILWSSRLSRQPT